jgi:hypothetical protein
MHLSHIEAGFSTQDRTNTNRQNGRKGGGFEQLFTRVSIKVVSNMSTEVAGLQQRVQARFPGYGDG